MATAAPVDTITTLRPADPATPLNHELSALRRAVLDICPQDATVGFTFTDRLRLTIDVRSYEEMAGVESVLAGIAGGAFRDVTRGSTPNQAFRRRLTALVDR